MKQVKSHIAVIIVTAIVVLTGWQSYVVVDFYSNQDVIEKEFCENLDRPELNCHGQCHLNQQLGETKVKSDDKSRIVNSSILVFQAFENLDLFSIPPFTYDQFNSIPQFYLLNDGFLNSLLDPPEIIS